MTSPSRHCEERSDEAIQDFSSLQMGDSKKSNRYKKRLDCFTLRVRNDVGLRLCEEHSDEAIQRPATFVRAKQQCNYNILKTNLLYSSYRKVTQFLLALLCLFFTACVQETPILSLGLREEYRIPRMSVYRFTPGYTGEQYRWTMQLTDGRDTLLSTEHHYAFVQKDEGIYNLTFEIIDPRTPYKFKFTVEVMHEYIEYSPYIAKVYAYCPAPGQFVNEMPKYEPGDTEETMRKKAEENISGKNNVMITLGGYGGYVTFGFDHTVMNVKGEKDFSIYGNAFYSLVDVGQPGGSSEPGIVMVAFDRNQNGQADEDEWYELAGSEHHKPETVHNYEITYLRPDTAKTPVPDPTGQITDMTHIAWTDNRGATGYIPKNRFHTQPYYPGWISGDELTFRGTRLKDNAEDLSGMGTYWVQYAYDWGYADNHPNELVDLISFDIDWAVDKNGRKVDLPGVDFIRVYTGVNQSCGWIGEISTEIIRARDLHIETDN
jgi:hypothetical protein